MLFLGRKMSFLRRSVKIAAIDPVLKNRLSLRHYSVLPNPERCVWPLLVCSIFIVTPTTLYLSGIISDYNNVASEIMEDMLVIYVFYFYKLIKLLDKKYVKLYSYMYYFLRREFVIFSLFFCLVAFFI